MLRFERQIHLLGEAGQRAISRARVLVVGAGGLGHPVAQYLSAMGVGTLGLVDGDVVAESNLHRQVLFSPEDIGRNKAETLSKKIKGLSPSCEVLALPFFLNKSSALEIFPSYDVVVDGTDNFASKFLINDVALFYGKPMVYGAISQFEAQVSVFQGSPCYRCLVPAAPQAKIQNCAESGVVGVLPGVVGCLQAMEVLKVILSERRDFSPLKGRLAFFDLATGDFRNLKLHPRPECRCQWDHISEDSIDDVMIPTCAVGGLLLDVREKSEWDEFHLKKSRHWPLSKIESGEYPLDLVETQLTLICRSGVRAERACALLKEKGFRVSFSRKGVYEHQV